MVAEMEIVVVRKTRMGVVGSVLFYEPTNFLLYAQNEAKK